jgi:hypothetical protein
MRTAEQLDLAGDLGQRGLDLRVHGRPWAIHSKGADLQEVELPVLADGEFDVNRITAQKGFEFPDQGNDRLERCRAGIRPDRSS